jgi:hypothetical protein
MLGEEGREKCAGWGEWGENCTDARRGGERKVCRMGRMRGRTVQKIGERKGENSAQWGEWGGEQYWG